MWFQGETPETSKMAGLAGHHGPCTCRNCIINGHYVRAEDIIIPLNFAECKNIQKEMVNPVKQM